MPARVAPTGKYGWNFRLADRPLPRRQALQRTHLLGSGFGAGPDRAASIRRCFLLPAWPDGEENSSTRTLPSNTLIGAVAESAPQAAG